MVQEQALCTYKDPDLPADARLDRALDILTDGCEDLVNTKNQETLGLAGAIHKRKFDIDGQRQHLERSLAYYLRGYDQGVENDYGYTGINAAYVLDLLAYQESVEAQKAAATLTSVQERRKEATEIRKKLIEVLVPMPNDAKHSGLDQKWWFLVTVGEAYFGLQRYPEALEWLQKASALPNVVMWERESTARQLAALARLQAEPGMRLAELERSEAWRVLSKFLGNDLDGVRSAFVGKVGLALSGGGFRASLYHIGVLARLAELDVLRSVEVLSCVSGGSIIGAHYYLEVRKLLQEKEDDQITREDYIAIVKRIEADFLTGVQRNVRTRVATNLFSNLKMMFCPSYSRTERVGNLYESEIYSRIKDGHGGGKRWLNKLFVNPKGECSGFTPKYGNWSRRAKVPDLILNATSLNTGHNWQFTASWMGESPAAIDVEVDGNYRLRRMYYADAPEAYKQIRLGHAVAASSCVPGVFEPLTFAGLYPDRTVMLVDGGVHDNQGVVGLLEQDCTVLLVSDGSGQMSTEDVPSRTSLGVPLRSNGILQARVREAQYHGLKARRRSSLLRGLMFVHLKKDLDVDPVNWVACDDPIEASDLARPAWRQGPLARYGIRKETQALLAGIRTDLDSFSDAEAYALMLSGYRMTEYEFPLTIDGFSAPPAELTSWRFFGIEDAMSTRGDRHEALMRVLQVSSQLAFKVWRLSRTLQVLAAILGIVAAAWIIRLLWTHRTMPLVTYGTLLWTIVGMIVVVGLGKTVGQAIMKAVRPRETLTRVAIGLGLSVAGWLAAQVHLRIFDKLYLRWGKIERFRKE